MLVHESVLTLDELCLFTQQLNQAQRDGVAREQAENWSQFSAFQRSVGFLRKIYEALLRKHSVGFIRQLKQRNRCKPA